MSVLHPRFVVVPKIEFLTGLLYFLGIAAVIRRLRSASRGFVLHAHCAYPDGVGVALVARWLRIPYVVTAHGSDINIYAPQRLIRPQVRWAMRGAIAVIAVSEALKAKIAQLTNGELRCLETIPCAGFDEQVFRPRPQATAREGAKLDRAARVILVVGNLVPIKGHDCLFDALTLLGTRGVLRAPDCIVVAGDGPLRRHLEGRAAAMTVPQVRFLGSVPQSEVARWMNAATLLCLPSRDEGMPNVVIEAMASGIPVVATRVGGLPEIVVEGRNGVLVERDSPSSLANGLERAMSESWDPAAVQQSVASLTWRSIAARNLELIQRRIDA